MDTYTGRGNLDKQVVNTALMQALQQYEDSLAARVRTGLEVMVGQEDYLVPDITVAPIGAEYKNGRLNGGAILTVFTVGQCRELSEHLSDCKKLHSFGNRTCWIVCCQDRKAWSYSASSLPEFVDVLRFEHIEILVARLFDET